MTESADRIGEPDTAARRHHDHAPRSSGALEAGTIDDAERERQARLRRWQALPDLRYARASRRDTSPAT